MCLTWSEPRRQVSHDKTHISNEPWRQKTGSDTNRAGRSLKIARGLKFRIKEVEGLYYPCSENKGADQLRGYREADQRLCFRYLDSTIPLLTKSKISSFWSSPVAVQPGLCQTWSESTLLVFSCCGSYCLGHSHEHPEFRLYADTCIWLNAI